MKKQGKFYFVCFEWFVKIKQNTTLGKERGYDSMDGINTKKALFICIQTNFFSKSNYKKLTK